MIKIVVINGFPLTMTLHLKYTVLILTVTGIEVLSKVFKTSYIFPIGFVAVFVDTPIRPLLRPVPQVVIPLLRRGGR